MITLITLITLLNNRATGAMGKLGHLSDQDRYQPTEISYFNNPAKNGGIGEYENLNNLRVYKISCGQTNSAALAYITYLSGNGSAPNRPPQERKISICLMWGEGSSGQLGIYIYIYIYIYV